MAENQPENTPPPKAAPSNQPSHLDESKDNYNMENDNGSNESVDTAPSWRKKDPRIFKIIVIGDSNCGKTCLTYRFCEGKFPNRVEATIGVDFREKVIEINGELLKLQLWDTAGQERFRRSMVPHYYRNIHAVVYVYDVTKRSSFDGLYDWLSELQQHTSSNLDIPRIVIGNKVDVEELRQVQTGEAQLFADKFNMPHFETSARDDDKTDHTDAIFMTLAHKLRASKAMMGKRYSSSGSQDRLATRPVVQQYTTIGQESESACC